MSDITAKRIERKSYLSVLLIAVIFMVVNTMVIFEFFVEFTETYLAILLIINIVIVSLLANATYYASRVKIDALYVSISYYAFFMIADYVMALVMLLINHEDALDLIGVTLSFGRFLLVFGIFAMKWKRTYTLFYNRIAKLFGLGALIIALQLGVAFVLVQGLFNLETYVFLTNGFSVMMLALLCYDLVLEEHREHSYVYLFAYTMILFGILLTALTTNSFEMLIQSHIIQAFGLAFFFYYVNRNNFIIPEGEQKRLQRQFNLYSNNLKKIIDKKTFLVGEANQKFIDELEYAKKIQQSLLPNIKTSYRDVNIVSGYFPCERLSGDFYDHYRLDDDNIALYLLDVSGHGISAALLTMLSNNYLKSNDKNQQLFRGLKPDHTLNFFYNQFNEMNFPDEMHMVAFYATLNLSTKMLTYCSAGLNCSPIRFRKNGKVEFLDKSEGFPICKLSEFVTPEYKSERMKLEKGDRLLFYTDGLIDQDKNNTFDLDSLIRFVNSHRNLSVDALNDLLVQSINPIKQALNDDITYVLVEV